MKAIVTALFGVLCLAGAGSSAEARPEYARREMKACSYCHVNPRGGGRRNSRGMYYQAHNLSFEGFSEGGSAGGGNTGGGSSPSDTPLVGSAKKTGPPAYISAWKGEAPAGTVRIGVGSLTEDESPRLITWGPTGPATIHTLGTGGLVKEATIDLGPGAKYFVVGRLAKGKPAVVVAPGLIWYRDGDKYTKKVVDYLKEVTGLARFADGLECVFSFSGTGQESWTLDNGIGKPLTEGRQLVPPEQGKGVYSELTARLSAEILANLGVPEGTQKIGVVGEVDARGNGNLYYWMPTRVGDDYFLVLANNDAISIAGQAAELKPVWKSPRLNRILDVATGQDPKGSKRAGFFILQATGADGKGRMIEFMALN